MPRASKKAAKATVEDASRAEEGEDTPTNVTELTIEHLHKIATYLAGDHAFGTLSSLNRTSKALKKETDAILWETVTLDKVTPDWHKKLKRIKSQGKPAMEIDSHGHDKLYAKDWYERKGAKIEGVSFPTGAQYTKFLIFTHDDCLIRKIWMHTMFPNLIMMIERCPEKEEGRDPGLAVDVRLYKHIKTQVAFGTILQTPMWTTEPSGAAPANTFQTPRYLDSFTFHPQSYIRPTLETNRIHDCPWKSLELSSTKVAWHEECPFRARWMMSERPPEERIAKRDVESVLELVKLVERVEMPVIPGIKSAGNKGDADADVATSTDVNTATNTDGKEAPQEVDPGSKEAKEALMKELTFFLIQVELRWRVRAEALLKKLPKVAAEHPTVERTKIELSPLDDMGDEELIEMIDEVYDKKHPHMPEVFADRRLKVFVI